MGGSEKEVNVERKQRETDMTNRRRFSEEGGLAAAGRNDGACCPGSACAIRKDHLAPADHMPARRSPNMSSSRRSMPSTRPPMARCRSTFTRRSARADRRIVPRHAGRYDRCGSERRRLDGFTGRHPRYSAAISHSLRANSLDVPTLFHQYGLNEIWAEAYGEVEGVTWLSGRILGSLQL